MSVTCLDCATAFPGEIIPEHKCLDPKTKRDNAPMKKARAEGARRELEALKRFPIPPCAMCGREDMRAGQQHTCKISTTPMAHEALANDWVRKGTAAALKAELDEMKGGPR